MKKFIALLISILMVLSLFAFAACGGDKQKETENKEPVTVKTTVTEEEWKAAFAFFEKPENYNFSFRYIEDCKSVEGEWFDKDDSLIKIDYNHKIAKMDRVNDYGDSDQTPIKAVYEDYYWLSGDGITYEYSHVSETKQGSAYSRITQHKWLFEMDFETFIKRIGDSFFFATIMTDNFGKFTYDEISNVYNASFANESYDELYYKEFSFFFEDNKITKLIAKNEINTTTITVDYNTVSLTVPDDILNMEVTEIE